MQFDEDDAGTTVLHLVTGKNLPRSWRTWLMGSHFPTSDALQQTSDIFAQSE